MTGKRWAAFRMISMLLVILSLVSAFAVSEYNESLFWLLLGITALTALAYLVLFSAAQKNLYHFVTEMESQLNLTERDSLYKFPAPAVIVDTDGTIIWYNLAFTEQVSGNDCFGLNINKIININLDKTKENKNTTVEYLSSHYKVSAVTTEKHDTNSDVTTELTLLYLEDISDYVILEEEFKKVHPSVLSIQIDNFEDIVSMIKESEKTHLTIEIEKLLESYFEQFGGIIRKVAADKFIAVVEDQCLEKMINDKFKILEKVRAVSISDKNTISLSIGIGRSGNSLAESEKQAKQALEMAQGRGGDQVAIKNENEFEFFGGVSKGIEKHTKVKTRIVSNALVELINNSGNILIMGHRYTDLDAVGAAAGLLGAIRCLNPAINVRCVIDMEHTLALPIINRLIENVHDEEDIFITPQQALEQVNNDSLVIVVDTHNKDLVESIELYEAAKKVVVIDHHRQTVNFIDNAVIFHHEPYASSASEMVAELIQYFAGILKIQSYYADAMLAGIMLDTKDFIMRTGVRTFEAAAFLRKLNADMVAVKGLFATSIVCVQKRSKLISSAEIYNRCAIAVSNDEDMDMRVASAQAADEMLSIEGASASFVIFMSAGTANISARSRGLLNVQIIMEKLGGGGHQTMAATQIANISAFEAKAQLIRAIDEYIATIS